MKKKIFYIITLVISLTAIILSLIFGIDAPILSHADEIPTFETYSDFNDTDLYYNGETITEEFSLKTTNNFSTTTGPYFYMKKKSGGSVGTFNTSSNNEIFLISNNTITAWYNNNPTTWNLTDLEYIRFDFRNNSIQTNFEDFKLFMTTYFTTDTPSNFLIFNSSNNSVNDNIKNIEFIYNANSIINDNITIGERYDLRNWINSSASYAQLVIRYKNLPKEIYTSFTNNNPISNISITTDTTGLNTTIITLTKNGSILFDNSVISITGDDTKKTLNYLTGKSFFLNQNIAFDYNMISSYTISNTETATNGYYISYIYNNNKAINEFMTWGENSFYNYLVKLDDKLMLYDNDNGRENGQLLTSGKFIYDFSTNEYQDDYGIVPRIITFLPNFNTNNLKEDLIYNGDYSGTITDFDFVEFILNNSVEFNTEQYNTFDAGYETGYLEGKDYSTQAMGWVSATFNQVDKILQVEILPNFKLWYLIGIPLLFTAVIFVLKLLR